MTKLTDILLNQKNSFIPRYGFNKSQKNGRKMETNPPTLNSILKAEEDEEIRKKSYKNNNCKFKLNLIRILILFL